MIWFQLFVFVVYSINDKYQKKNWFPMEGRDLFVLSASRLKLTLLKLKVSWQNSTFMLKLSWFISVELLVRYWAQSKILIKSDFWFQRLWITVIKFKYSIRFWSKKFEPFFHIFFMHQLCYFVFKKSAFDRLAWNFQPNQLASQYLTPFVILLSSLMN